MPINYSNQLIKIEQMDKDKSIYKSFRQLQPWVLPDFREEDTLWSHHHPMCSHHSGKKLGWGRVLFCFFPSENLSLRWCINTALTVKTNGYALDGRGKAGHLGKTFTQVGICVFQIPQNMLFSLFYSLPRILYSHCLFQP